MPLIPFLPADDTDESRDVADPSDESAMKLTVDQSIVTRSGILRILGWVACYSNLKAVEIYLDDALLGLAELGLERGDVAETWSNYPNALKSGFKLNADVGRFEGPKTLVVKARAAGGISREARVPILIKTPSVTRAGEEIHRLECDEIILTTAGDLFLKGWARPLPVSSSRSRSFSKTKPSVKSRTDLTGRMLEIGFPNWRRLVVRVLHFPFALIQVGSKPNIFCVLR